MKKIKAIYIFSLDHSGSTFLDFLLSHHKEIIGLGEVFSVFREIKSSSEKTKSVCSCGNDMKNCPFWFFCQTKNSYSDIEKYRNLIRNVKKEGFNIFIDSTKRFDHLKTLRKLEKEGWIDLKVIFLIRDVRGWTNSVKKLGEKHRREMKIKGNLNFRNILRIKERLGLKYLYFFVIWVQRNKEILKFLEKSNYSFLKINYDTLCFHTEESLENIFDFVGLNKENFSLKNKPNTHIAYGNRMKMNNKKRKEIIYDSGWFYNFWLNFSFVVFWVLFKKDLKKLL